MKRLIQIWLFLCCVSVSAQEIQDSVKIHFRTGSSVLDLGLSANRSVLDDITEKMQLKSDDSIYYRLHKVLVVGGASPEGSVSINKRLSEKRALTLFKYLSNYGTFPESIRHFTFVGRDWNGLLRLAEADMNLPFREETLELLRSIAANPKDADLWRLRSLKRGKPYAYMSRHLFPELRASSMYLWYSEVKLPPFSAHTSLKKPFTMSVPVVEAQPWVLLPLPEPEKAFCFALKSNLLYDALSVLNFEVEVPIGKEWSVTMENVFPWWHSGNKYALQMWEMGVEGRYWFKRTEDRDVLSGWFGGVYAMSAMYDFQWKRDVNYQGEYWSAGLTCGYAMPLGKHLNLEFSASMGYLSTAYRHYVPSVDYGELLRDPSEQGRLGYWGPTKLKVSLVLPITIYRKEVRHE